MLWFYYEYKIKLFIMSIITFESKTQYDKSYDSLFDKNSECSKGFSCAYFTLITSWKFFNGYENNKITHDFTVDDSVNFSALYLATSLTFVELVENYTNLDKQYIMCTTTELIKENIVGFNEIFSNSDNKYCVIFLKNEKYIVVMVDNNKYYVRDCHESEQYNFDKIDDLIDHLNKKYQFSENINITGIDYSDYSSIEFIKIKKNFMCLICDMIGILPYINIQFEEIQNEMTSNILPTKENTYLELLDHQLNIFSTNDSTNETNKILNNYNFENISDDKLNDIKSDEVYFSDESLNSDNFVYFED